MNIRQNQILDILKEKKLVTVSNLSQLLHASESTIRRDLTRLHEDGLIRRTRGGAVYVEASSLEWPLFFKNQTNADKKLAIADYAIDFVKDGQTIFIDSSSTCMMLAKRLSEKENLSILTNGVMTSHILSESSDSDIYCACGKIFSKRSSLNGVDTCEYISNFRADIAFVSCRGIAAETGVTDFIQGESMVKRTYRRYAKKLILLVDSTKHDLTFFHKTFDFKDIDIVITDKPFPADIRKVLDKVGAEIVVVDN